MAYNQDGWQRWPPKVPSLHKNFENPKFSEFIVQFILTGFWVKFFEAHSHVSSPRLSLCPSPSMFIILLIGTNTLTDGMGSVLILVVKRSVTIDKLLNL